MKQKEPLMSMASESVEGFWAPGLEREMEAWQLTGIPRLDSLSELLHENTKIHPGAAGFVVSAEALQIMSEGYKTYELGETIALPTPSQDLAMPVGQAMQSRRSIRDFTDRGIHAAELSTLLFYGCGQLHGGGRRMAPSAGALYPLEAYLIVLRDQEAVQRGVYHYCVRHHRLERILSAGTIERLGQAVFVKEVVETAAVFIVVSAVFGRTRIKYGERGYRFVLLEAGHVAQNLCLTAVAMNLGACPIGGFIDDYVNEVLDLDGVDEAPVYMVAVGSIPESH